MLIKPAKSIMGEIVLPGDKSISHRAAIFAALAEGDSKIENYSTGEDCQSTLECLTQLRVPIRREGTTVFINGVGKRGFHKPSEPIDCGNSGTTIRLLAGVLAGQEFDSVMTGDESLTKRPMKRIIDPLALMGAGVESQTGNAPLKISGQNALQSIAYDLPVASAQVKSCVLLAGLNAVGVTTVSEPESKLRKPPSRDHTEVMLKYLGAEIEESFLEREDGFVHQVSISRESKLKGRDLFVPSDISSAAFFLVAAACLEGSELVIKNVGLNPTRTAIIEVLGNTGVEVEVRNETKKNGEVIGDLTVCGTGNFNSGESATRIERHLIPNLIDEIPVLAVLGTQLPNGLEIRNAEELRVKESDRISAIVENLQRMGVEVKEFEDGFKVERSELIGAEIDSFGDHRIAMAFTVAGLLAKSETTIKDAECASISFPEFFDILANVVK